MKLNATPTDKTVTSREPSDKDESVSVGTNPVGRLAEEKELNIETMESSEKADARPKVKKDLELRPNRVRQCRIESMMSKAELARRANLSVLTIDRLEKGFGCRMHTKRKILEALGLSLADRVRVFGEEEE
jgi:DNA-binding XRE family transcriptional regulator